MTKQHFKQDDQFGENNNVDEIDQYRPAKAERIGEKKKEHHRPRPPVEDDLDEELRKALELSK